MAEFRNPTSSWVSSAVGGPKPSPTAVCTMTRALTSSRGNDDLSGVCRVPPCDGEPHGATALRERPTYLPDRAQDPGCQRLLNGRHVCPNDLTEEKQGPPSSWRQMIRAPRGAIARFRPRAMHERASVPRPERQPRIPPRRALPRAVPRARPNPGTAPRRREHPPPPERHQPSYLTHSMAVIRIRTDGRTVAATVPVATGWPPWRYRSPSRRRTRRSPRTVPK